MSLYNLRTADGSYRITKFTNDLDVEASYLVSPTECECPAGHRPSCRHRQMLPKMLAVGADDQPMFYDHDNDRFFEQSLGGEESFESQETQGELPLEGKISADESHEPQQIATSIELTADATSEDIANAFGDLIHDKPIHSALTGTLRRRI